MMYKVCFLYCPLVCAHLKAEGVQLVKASSVPDEDAFANHCILNTPVLRRSFSALRTYLLFEQRAAPSMDSGETTLETSRNPRSGRRSIFSLTLAECPQREVGGARALGLAVVSALERPFLPRVALQPNGVIGFEYELLADGQPPSCTTRRPRCSTSDNPAGAADAAASPRG